MTADDNKALLQAIYQAFFDGDLEKWLSFFDDDSLFWEASSLPYGGTHKGVEAIRATVAKVVDCWAEIAFDVEEILASERRVIAYGIFRGTARATGRKVSFPLAEMWLFRDGKVSELAAVYGDTALAASALGHDGTAQTPMTASVVAA